MMDYQNVPVIVCFNKVELVDEKEQERLRSIYEKCGCRVLFMSIYENKGVDELKNSVDSIGKSIKEINGFLLSAEKDKEKEKENKASDASLQ